MRWAKLPPHDGVVHWKAASPCTNGTLVFWISRWSSRQNAELWCEQIRGWSLESKKPTESGIRSLKRAGSSWAKALRGCQLRLHVVPNTVFQRARKLVEGH